MKASTLILTAVLSMAPAIGARAGVGLSPEAGLPLADGRDAYEPGAAFGKDVFLVAWQSGNLDEGDLREGMKYVGDLVACRVDKSGKVIDAKPLALSSAPDLQERPRIAFGPSTGSGRGSGVFLVVWQDLRNEKDWDVYAARVTPEGKVLDPKGILVAGGAHNQAVPELAWDGKNFQVVWQDFRCGDRYEIYGARVSSAGKVLEPGGSLFVTEKKPYSRFNPVVAAIPGGGKTLLFWYGIHNNRNVPLAGSHLVADGRVAATPAFTNPSYRVSPGGQYGQFPASLSAGPKGYLAAWTTGISYSRGGALNDAHAAMFKPDGKLGKLLHLVPKSGNLRRHPRVRNSRSAWDGKSFVVAWDQRFGQATRGKAKWDVEVVFTTRVSAEGAPGAAVQVAGGPGSPAIKPAVASDGKGTTLIAYEQHPAKAETPIRIGFRMLGTK